MDIEQRRLLETVMRSDRIIKYQLLALIILMTGMLGVIIWHLLIS